MNKPLPGSDTKPWYKHFWPWFLMALPATVVVAGFQMLYIAINHGDDLVVDDYYKDGLGINQSLAKKELADAMGLAAQLHFSGDYVTVDVTGPINDAGLRLLLSHPFEADRDLSVPLVRVAPGSYHGSLSQPVGQHWHWVLEGLQQSDWRLDGAVQAADIDNAPGR